MDAETFQAFCRKRAERARELGGSRNEAAQALVFLAEVAEAQASPELSLRALVSLVRSKGPEPLRETGEALDEAALSKAMGRYRSREDTRSPASFFARVLLQPEMARGDVMEASSTRGCCPQCGHLPQVGCLRREGDGRKLHLQCSLCFSEWPHPRGHCPGCGETRQDEIAFYKTSEIPEVEVQTCHGCRSYLHLVDVSRHPSIVPEIDEVGALVLDVWARERGFSKIQPNLVGI